MKCCVEPSTGALCSSSIESRAPPMLTWQHGACNNLTRRAIHAASTFKFPSCHGGGPDSSPAQSWRLKRSNAIMLSAVVRRCIARQKGRKCSVEWMETWGARTARAFRNWLDFCAHYDPHLFYGQATIGKYIYMYKGAQVVLCIKKFLVHKRRRKYSTNNKRRKYNGLTTADNHNINYWSLKQINFDVISKNLIAFKC